MDGRTGTLIVVVDDHRHRSDLARPGQALQLKILIFRMRQSHMKTDAANAFPPEDITENRVKI